MTFEHILNKIKKNKENHQQGYFNCIPFMGMDRTEKFIPGIEQDTYYLLTASSGVGKSKLARNLFIHNPYKYLQDHPESGIKLSIKYFSLEESREKVILSEISKYLYAKYKIVVSIKQLQSRGRYNTIPEDVIEKIAEAEEYINEFLKVVDIVDGIRNPTGIYKYVRDFALSIGKYYDKNHNPLTPEETEQVKIGKGEAYKKVAYYKKDHPKHYVIILTDHISLLENESENGIQLTQWQTIGKYSSKYCLHFRDKFGFIPVNVQQQASAKEQVEYNYKGKSIEEKLEPSLDGLGDNKTTQRDANMVLGLFAPDRYNITNHGGYDIGFMKDRYRCMSILKDRDGEANKKIPLFFNGAVDYFKELPPITDTVNMEKVYALIRTLNKK